VSFDLTHGFRHLGMVGMLSAFMLERIGRVAVRSL
jgi:CRISPR-associated DxTHG motif protein